MIAKIYSDIKCDFKYYKEFNQCSFFDKNLNKQKSNVDLSKLDYEFILFKIFKLHKKDPNCFQDTLYLINVLVGSFDYI